jgi:flagellum-specific peptidoglycan hydrolase FlgJ
MPAAGKPRWQQLTALVSISAGGAITGFSFVPGPAADLASPSGMPIHLMALQQSAQPAPQNDAMLRSAIVNVADYYLRMARDRTPAEMEAIIWQNDSVNGADHGQSCAAFASLTLELAAQVVGQRSWVTGGTSYPWPIHKWADVRVDPNPASPGVTSIRQDAEAHHRWHPLGDGYEPQPGDWALFGGHVEVIKSYAHGVLHTIGGDSLPDFSVNAHKFSAPLGDQGVVGFVNNGELAGPAGKAQAHREHASRRHRARAQTPVTLAAIPGAATAGSAQPAPARHGSAAIPSMPAPVPSPGNDAQAARPAARQGQEHPPPGRNAPDHTSRGKAADAGAESAGASKPPATSQAARGAAARGAAAIPGLSMRPHRHHAGSGVAHRGSAGPPGSSRAAHRRPRPAPLPAPAAPQDINTQEAFIGDVAPGAVAAQRKYGVPAAVTIAQAIDESGWGQSELAIRDHNLFGIKGTGPAGSDPLPTQEYENGRPVSRTAAFRRYDSAAESIDDHGKLLATSGYYTQAMAERQNPNSFAAALTGVYATDPDYGAKLVGLMRRYDLYRYDLSGPAAHHPATPAATPTATSQPPTPTTPTDTPQPATPTATPSVTTPTATPPPSSPAVTPSASTPPAAVTPTPQASTPTATTTPIGAPQTAPATGPAASAGPAPMPAAPTAATAPPATAPATAAPAATPATPPQRAKPAGAPRGARQGGASIPGLPSPLPPPAQRADAQRSGSSAMPSTQTESAQRVSTPVSRQPRRTAAAKSRAAATRYQQNIPRPVQNAFISTARAPLMRAEPLYRDVASHSGIRWELLAACDWMQCKAQPRYSPVHGEKLGTLNPSGTIYRTKSAALEQCAEDLAELAHTVYRIDLTAQADLSIRDLAKVFAAFRWGGLLKLHHTSAMEFPYSVAGLTVQHIHMRWPNIDEPNTPDKPGSRFRMTFGALPIVLGLHYPATA